MKQTTERVYRCDFCNKAMVSSGFMKTHERMCKHNPKNQHQCFKFCKHLIKEKCVIEYGCDDYVGSYRISFHCDLNPKIELYSYKLERYQFNKNRIKNMERMPLICELYESEDGHGFIDEPIDLDSDFSSEFSF